MAHVGGHSVNSDAELDRGRLVVMALAQEREQPQFLRGKLMAAAMGRVKPAEKLHHAVASTTP
jgi:hypothetical protein